MTIDFAALPQHAIIDSAASTHNALPRTLPADSLGTPAGRHLVALDIDGTTVRHDGTLNAPVRAAVRRTVHAGHEVVIATGRSVLSAAPVIQELGLTRGFAVCSNGAVTLRLDPLAPQGWRIIDARTFRPGQVLGQLRETFPAGGLAVERAGTGYDVFGPFPHHELDGVVRPASWERMTAAPTTRVTFSDPHADVEEFAENVGAMGLHGVNYAVGFTAWLDITATGVSKASGLEAIRRHTGVDPARTVAVGDQRNDLEMLAWAARGVAMGNAPAEVGQVADYVTSHVNDNGLADVLNLLPRA